MTGTRLSDGTSEQDHYLIRGGAAGRQRLRVLARMMWPTTRELLGRVGVPEDARCLDVGCGGGDVTIPLARLAPGEDATFARGGPGHPVRLRIDHPGVGRLAGRITAAEDHWLLSNLCADRTYLVENPEGAGEHVKVAPRRLEAPIPFELARVVLPADPAPLKFVVFAPPTGSSTTAPSRRRIPRPPRPCSRWTRRPSTSWSSPRCASRGCAMARRRRCPPTRRSSTGCGGCPRAGTSPAARSTSTSTTWPGPSCACASRRTPSARGWKGAAPPWCPSRSASTWSGRSTWPCCRPAWGPV